MKMQSTTNMKKQATTSLRATATAVRPLKADERKVVSGGAYGVFRPGVPSRNGSP
jgi:hypothetical protein